MTRWPMRSAGAAIVAALLLLVVLVPARPARGHEPGLRGEAARLARQAYDYHYRNSNDNVFRRSRHFHPTKNVFRSSRYYQQRLAASYDGYPLRTIVRYTRHTPRGPHEEVISFVHPRRHPYGPGPAYCDAGYAGHRGRALRSEPPAPVVIVVPGAAAAEPEPEPGPRTRAEIEMVPVRVAARPATQRAVLRTITRPDGTTTTVIASEPIETDADAAPAGGSAVRDSTEQTTAEQESAQTASGA